jgi:CRISPR-associated protein Csb2
MVRGTAATVAKDAGWPATKVAAFILGHGEADNETHKPVGPQRFAFLPLPSIEGRGAGKPQVVGSIRRVLVTAFADGCEAEIAWARPALANQPLIDEKSKEEVALLASLPASDPVVRQYTGTGSCWATVTPVVLPGYDDPDHLRRRAKDKRLSPEQQRRMLDRLAQRVDGLLRKAIRQAGFADALAQHAVLEWRSTGFWPGTELASRYGVPDYLKRFPRLHVRIEWRDTHGKPVPVPGPICIGGGRYFGLGLFAPMFS